MKKLMCIVCVFALLMSMGLVNVFAALAPLWAGDTDLDHTRTVKDATLVQKYVANMLDFTLLQKSLADADEDGSVTVKDATAIQKHIAKIEMLQGSVYPYVDSDSFYSDFDSGKAMAGVPVTFTATGHSSDKIAEPLTYEFYVNDELIEERGDKNSFTYTFESAGTYKVEIRIYNGYDYFAECADWGYEVVKPYESDVPVIKAFYSPAAFNMGGRFDPESENIPFVAEAIFGEGDYEYVFLLDGKMVRSLSKDNTFTLKTCPEESARPYVLTVMVKDSISNEFISADYVFEIGYEPPA